MSSLSVTLNLVDLGLMLVLVGILVRHKLYYVFPPFFAYCVFGVCAQVVEIALGGHTILYFFAIWLIQGVYVVLALVAMFAVLRPYTVHVYTRYPWSRLLFLPFVALLVFSSLWAAFVRPIDTTVVARFASAIYVFVILMTLVELGLFIISYRAKPSNFLYWKDQVFAIVLGFGVQSAINLVAYTALILRLLHLRVAPQLESIFQLVPSGAFIGSTVIWLMEFWNPKDLPKEPPDWGKMKDALRVMQEQLEADMEYIKKVIEVFGLRFAAARLGRIYQR